MNFAATGMGDNFPQRLTVEAKLADPNPILPSIRRHLCMCPLGLADRQGAGL